MVTYKYFLLRTIFNTHFMLTCNFCATLCTLPRFSDQTEAQRPYSVLLALATTSDSLWNEDRHTTGPKISSCMHLGREENSMTLMALEFIIRFLFVRSIYDYLESSGRPVITVGWQKYPSLFLSGNLSWVTVSPHQIWPPSSFA